VKFLVSINVDSIDKVKNVLKGMDVELNISSIIRSRIIEFIPKLAIELEDKELNVKYVKVLTLPKSTKAMDIIDRVLNLLDYLNVKYLILNPKDKDFIIDVTDTASLYGIKVVWRFSKKFFKDLSDVYEVANLITPKTLKLAIDVSSRRSLKDFTKTILTYMNFVKVVYYNNKSRVEAGLSIFDRSGVIDYLKITKVLNMVRYSEDIILNYKPQYYVNYLRDLDLLKNFIETTGTIVDERVKGFISKISQELFTNLS